MSHDFDRNLDKYAEVILKIGLNLQPGQRLLIGWPSSGLYGVPLELAPLVRLITRRAYDMGARLVQVLWNDDELRRIRFQHAPPGTMEEFPEWRAAAAIQAAEAGDAVLRVSAQDPDLLADQEPDLVALFNATNSRHMAPFAHLLSRGAMNWCVITAPVAGWSEKLFPGLSAADARARFWDALFEICRINEPDPVAAWQAHIEHLMGRAEHLTRMQYSAVSLRAPGTDLTIGLPQHHKWTGAHMRTQGGIDFCANIPTEEVFTTTHAARTEGVVSMTKPLSYGGAVMEGLRMTFSGGRLTKMTADTGEEFFRQVLDIDEGARHLGEIALVPHSSPISQAGRLFYSTLIDENAVSHIAVGRGFPFAVQGGAEMSAEEFASAGGNNSLVHIDVMVGSSEMDVDGVTESGTTEPIMRAGEWAFDL